MGIMKFKTEKEELKYNDFLEQFKHKDINFVVSAFEELMLNDIYQSDENTKIKLNRNVTKLFFDEINLYINEKRNIRYSLCGETRSNLGNTEVLLANYDFKRLDKMTKNDVVFSLNLGTNKFEKKQVQEIYENGYQECYELILEGGRKISSSKFHKFLSVKQNGIINSNPIRKNRKIIGRIKQQKLFTKPEWVEVENLEKGQYLAIPKKIEVYEETGFDLNTLKLIGFYLADGSLTRGSVVFDLTKQQKIDYLRKLENNNQSLNFKLRQNSNGRDLIKNPTWNKGYKFCFNKQYDLHLKQKDDFSQLIYDLGLNDKICYDKFIPTKIKLGTEKELYALLGGLFTGDGHIDKTKGLCYNTTSKRLITDIKIILSKLGLSYSEKIKISNCKGKKYKSFEVYISKYKDCEIMFKNCDFCEFKTDRLKIYLAKKSKRLPPQREVCQLRNIIFKKIISKKYIGKQLVYDIEIKDNHNYIANLIVSHNSGKSYVGLKITSLILAKNNINFNDKIDYFVCGNQIEYRQKLQKAKFGEFYLVDENYFTRAGLGSNIEFSQLQDYNNIIAKKNIGSIFITPEKFLNVGSVLGFSTYGRDKNNWLSKMLLFKFKNKFPYLIGYVIVDIGDLFRKNGCYVYKEIGGCNNNSLKEYSDLSKDNINYSWCIPDKYKFDLELLKPTISRNEDKTISSCPFYKICNHGLAKYERKKDTWINKELKGGLDERTFERFSLAVKLIIDLTPTIDINSEMIKLKARNGKDLKNKVKLKVHKYTNTKMGIAEFDELIEIIKSNTDIEFLCDTLNQLDIKELNENVFNLEGGDFIKSKFEELRKQEKKNKKKE